MSDLLGIDYPIVQGPLGGLASQRLTAAVSNHGGLGSFGAHGLAPSAIRDVIDEIRSLTSKPFAMNLWVSMEDEGARGSDAAAFERSRDSLAEIVGASREELPKFEPYSPMSFEEQLRVLVDARVPVFGFICGIPRREVLDECRALGIVRIGTATTGAEAVALEAAGVDIVVASGFEAGGHRGSFLAPAEGSLVGTFALVAEVVECVSVPVIAAGGIADARGIAAAFDLGAEGVQIGTAFVACEESGASVEHRRALLADGPKETVLTRALTGRLARGLLTPTIEALNERDLELLPYPLQRFLVRRLARTGSGYRELEPMWAGQSAGLVRHAHANDLLDELVSETSAILGDSARADH